MQARDEVKDSWEELKRSFRKLDDIGKAQGICFFLGPIICCIAIAGAFGWWGVTFDLGLFFWWYGYIGVKS